MRDGGVVLRIDLVGGRLEDALHELNETLPVVLGRDARDSGVAVP